MGCPDNYTHIDPHPGIHKCKQDLNDNGMGLGSEVAEPEENLQLVLPDASRICTEVNNVEQSGQDIQNDNIENLENPDVDNVILENLDVEPNEPVGASEEFEISFETDNDGRRILPSRLGLVSEVSLVTSSSSSEEVPSLNGKRKSLVSSLLIDPKRPRPESTISEDDSINLSQGGRSIRVLRSEDDPLTWSKGRGKGGRNMRVLRGKITKQTQETHTNVKVLWKQWVKGYTEEINDIIKNNPRGLHIVCEDCDKKVAKPSYLRHRTVNGCTKINPRIKLFNWN